MNQETPKHLNPFLKAYLEWSKKGAPDHPVFDDRFGLCMNYGNYSEKIMGEVDHMYMWLSQQFPTNAIGDDGKPIGNSYPFEYRADGRLYPEALEYPKHKNPRRIAWIKEYLEKHDV